jgi:hypothetical protein
MARAFGLLFVGWLVFVVWVLVVRGVTQGLVFTFASFAVNSLLHFVTKKQASQGALYGLVRVNLAVVSLHRWLLPTPVQTMNRTILVALLIASVAGCSKGSGTILQPGAGRCPTKASPNPRCPELPALTGRVPNRNQCEWIDIERVPAGFKTALEWVDMISGSSSSIGSSGVVLVDYLRLVGCVYGQRRVLREESFTYSSDIKGDTYLLDPWWYEPPGEQIYTTHVVTDTLGGSGVLVVRPGDKTDRIFHFFGTDESFVSSDSVTTVWVEARLRVAGDAMVRVGYDLRQVKYEKDPCQGGQSRWFTSANASSWLVVVLPSGTACP